MSVRKALLVGLVSICAASTAADRYRIDPQHSFAGFTYQHWGLSTQDVRFDNTVGTIELDPVAGTGTIDIVIDAASVSSGVDAFNKTLRSAEFFDVANHPDIRFRSSQVHFDGDRLTQLEGALTVKGITRPVVLDIGQFNCRFMLIYGRQTCGANGSARILRSDFNMGSYVPFVGDEVTLHFSVEGIRE
jgi:polyisoprenoid-binding protein YceI